MNINKRHSSDFRSIYSRYGMIIRVVVFIAVLLVLPLHASVYPFGITNELDLTIDGVGRITTLNIGSQSILFCNNSPTGGFYIRDNSIPSGSQIPTGCTNLLTDSILGIGTIFTPPVPPAVPESNKWYKFSDTDLADPTIVVNAEILGSNPSNYAAQIKVGESEYGTWGHYGGIYQILGPDKLGIPSPAEHELYYLTFEVKTECGWRAKDRPDGHTQQDDDIYGRHRISAFVEWSEEDELFDTAPARKPNSESFGNQFYADGTSQGIDEDGAHLTRFCGRMYRPQGYDYARIVLLVDGFMPFDRPVGSAETNEVYIDNVYFFKAPPIVPVAGSGLLGSSSGSASLYNYDIGPEALLNLDMDYQRTVVDDEFIRVAGTLTNTLSSSPQAIDLGFAFPIKDDTTQPLEWHYDVRNRILISGADPLDRAQPFTFSGPIDSRPETDCNRDIPTSNFPHNNNQQISVYPMSSLGIAAGGTSYGLAFGDDLTGIPSSENFTPSISHFGYRIVHPDPGDDFDGYYFVEFNIGLLPGANPQDYSDFDFIIFRSDNPDFAEASSFREGLQKYQRSIFPASFQRPTTTDDRSWLFGGGFFAPQRNETPGSYWDTNGFTSNPNNFGFRYTQDRSNYNQLLPYCLTNNVNCQIYDLPWAGSFDPSQVNDRNTYSKLSIARNAYDPGAGFPNLIYQQKLLRVLHIQPNVQTGAQEIFAPLLYRFPVILADSPILSSHNGNPGGLVARELQAVDALYSNFGAVGECFSGIELDNTFNYDGNSNHLDLNENRMMSFVENGGRMTYSFNHFWPAIPQLCTNVWYFSHLDAKLSEIDSSSFHGDNYASENIEQEIITVNSNESDFGGSKYGIICADVIGFESSAERGFNNSSHSFNFRRSVARDKSVTRLFNSLDCTVEVGSMFGPDNQGPAKKFWGSKYDLARQIFDEVSWIALAWGFHPSVQILFPEDYFGGSEAYDVFVEDFIRDRFITLVGGGAAFGYTEISRQLHTAQWQPATNVVNQVHAEDLTLPGDPLKLYIERFGPYEGYGLPTRPVYVTLLNNEDFKVTCTDVVDYESVFISISELETDLEVEQSNICAGKYGNPDEYDLKDKVLFEAASDAEDKNFFLVFSDLVDLILDEGNIHGRQMSQSDDTVVATNYPTIIADYFSETGDEYSIIRYNHGTQLRLGGPRPKENNPQEVGEIEDKALMVFKLWVEMEANNDDPDGGSERGDADNPYYQYVGDWNTVSDETARRGSVDVISSEEQGAYALFSIDIVGNALYEVQVAYPDMVEGTSGAKYEVYLREESCDQETGETTSSSISGPLLTTIVDQSRNHTETMDADRFVSIGEIDARRGSEVDNLSVVVKVSSAGAERRAGRATLLLADAVRVENLDR